MVGNFVSSGAKSGDRVLRSTMLVDNLFQNIVLRRHKHGHSIDRNIFYDFSELCLSLAGMEDDWCKDRIIHLGIFNCILEFIRDKRHGAWITSNGLKAIITILDSYEEDPERKDIVMAQLASCEVQGITGLSIIEELYQDENEEITDMVVDILDGHFGYDEEFFCDEDGYPYCSRENDFRGNFYEEDVVFKQAERSKNMFHNRDMEGGCTVEEIKEEETPKTGVFNI